MKTIGRSDELTRLGRMFERRRWFMVQAKLVNVGVDTLVLNAFYTDERGRPVKYDLDESLRLQFDAWKREAQEFHVECPTTLIFNEAVLHMAPMVWDKVSGPGCSTRPCASRSFQSVLLPVIKISLPG